MVTYISTGATLGALLGLVLGTTFWSHSPGIEFVVIIAIFVLACLTVGGWIGYVAGTIGEREEKQEDS